LPKGKRNKTDFATTQGWDKLNGSEQYDRMVYIQEELERRQKEREKEEEIGYNGGKENEAALNGLFETWDRQYAGERNGVLPGRIGKQFTRGQIGGNAEKYGAAGALFEARERIGEGASPERIRGALTGHPEATLPNGQNAERLRMFQTAGKRDRAAEREPREDSGQKLFFPGGREEMLEYLREHPDAALPNGMSGRTIAKMDKIMQSKKEQELNPSVPGYLKTEDDIREMQEALGVEATGTWNSETDLAYKERMDEADGLLYQDEEKMAGLPFDKDGMTANGCATTATHNVLELMGVDVPFEETYAWHRENGNDFWPGTIPWRTEKYIREEIPEVNIRSVTPKQPFGGLSVTSSVAAQDSLKERTQNVINEDGYGILCYAYKNEDGSLGAHYVAVEKNPESGGIIDWGGDEFQHRAHRRITTASLPEAICTEKI